MAYHLISIGISAYSNPANTLNFPDQDAGELSAIMRHSLGSDLTYDALLRDSEATQIGIRTTLDSDELKSASSADTLILYYSGHGALAQNADGVNEAYLAPYDVNNDIKISGISTSEIQEKLDSLKHGNKIMLLDCCYSGGINSKSITSIKHKDLKNIKAFQNQSFAEGTLVFTACKEDETAIEVHDLKHGLFTYHLIQELVSGADDDTVALSSLHHPITKAVEAAAKQYSHTQTPTINLQAKGSMSLPSLSKPPSFKPGIIKVPTIKNDKPSVAMVPIIEISDKKTQELIQSTISLVEQSKNTKLSQIAFRSMLGKVFAAVREVHAKQNNQANDVEELAGILAKLESQSFQLILTSAVVVLAGDSKAQKIFCDEAAQVLLWKRGKNGMVAVIETSDVVFMAILYIVFVCSIYTEDYEPIGNLLSADISDPIRGRQGSYARVIEYYEIQYANALGGNAKNVVSHMVELLTSQKWLLELLGLDESRLTALILQANLCLCVAMSRTGERVYAGYNDHDLAHLTPLINKIRTDSTTQESIGKHLLGVSADEVSGVFAAEVGKLNKSGDGHWGQYLKPRAFQDGVDNGGH